ncbi:MAG: diphthine synthase [DPANN group archaeon]|nr:diphthine synthase [DPANN group archaeon]
MAKLYIIGLGIGNEKDISINGLDACKKSKTVFAEFYTCPVDLDLKNLEKLIGKQVIVLDRADVEDKDIVFERAKSEDVAFIVGGDPLSATTHSDIVYRVRKEGISVEIIHASSIFSAIAESGLHLYKFGKTVSIPFPKENYFPTSAYDMIFDNLSIKAHTLALLDIGMSANCAMELFLELEGIKKKAILSEETEIIVLAHLGNGSNIYYGIIKDLIGLDFGKMPHSIIIPSELHFQELDFVSMFKQ